jgi:hypothetical protein
MAKIIHQQTAIKYKLFDGNNGNTPPHSRYKPEPVFIHRDRSIVIGKTVHFNRRCKALTDTGNKTAFVIDTAGPLAHKLPQTDVQLITKYEKLCPGNKKSTGNLTTYLSSQWKEWSPVITKNFLKYPQSRG